MSVGYRALAVIALVIPIVLISIHICDHLDEGDEVAYVIYHSGDEGEYIDTDVVAECMFTNPGHVFIGWNTEEDGSGDWHMPGEDLGLRNEAAVLYAQWEPEDSGPQAEQSLV